MPMGPSMVRGAVGRGGGGMGGTEVDEEGGPEREDGLRDVVGSEGCSEEDGYYGEGTG